MVFHTLKTRPHPSLISNAYRGVVQATAQDPSISTEGAINTRFLLLSDTHSYELFPANERDYAFRSPLPKADVLLHAGDLSWSGGRNEYRRTFNVIKSADAQLKIVIAGNHDRSLDEGHMLYRYHPRNRNPDFDEVTSSIKIEDYLEVVKEECKDMWELWTGAEAREAGIVYLEEGTHTFTLSNGARFTIYTSPFSPEFCGWAFGYNRERDRFNQPDSSPFQDRTDAGETAAGSFVPPEPIPSWPLVDIVMTHGPPMFHLDSVERRRGALQGYVPVGCVNLTAALERVRPRLSVFGHIHECWGAERIDWDREGSNAENLKRFAGMAEDSLIRSRNDTKGGKHWIPGKGTESIDVSFEEAIDKGFASIDVTANASRPLKWGKESLLVNAAILNPASQPLHAPWIIDLDLPSAVQGCANNGDKADSDRKSQL